MQLEVLPLELPQLLARLPGLTCSSIHAHVSVQMVASPLLHMQLHEMRAPAWHYSVSDMHDDQVTFR
jgi:hypothetical protein